MTTLNQVAMDMGMYEVPIQLLEHFVENYQNKSFTLEVLKNDKVLHTPLKKEKPKTVKKEKKEKKIGKKICEIPDQIFGGKASMWHYRGQMSMPNLERWIG